MSIITDALKQKKQEEQREDALSACATTFWTVVIGSLFILLGWNYGITEMIDALGGPDGNINYLHSLAAFVFLGVLKFQGVKG